MFKFKKPMTGTTNEVKKDGNTVVVNNYIEVDREKLDCIIKILGEIKMAIGPGVQEILDQFAGLKAIGEASNAAIAAMVPLIQEIDAAVEALYDTINAQDISTEAKTALLAAANDVRVVIQDDQTGALADVATALASVQTDDPTPTPEDFDY